MPPRAWSSVQVGSVFLTDDQYERVPGRDARRRSSTTRATPRSSFRIGGIDTGVIDAAQHRSRRADTRSASRRRTRRSTRAIRSSSRRRSAAVRALDFNFRWDGVGPTRGADSRPPTASRTRAARPCRSRPRREARRWTPPATTVFVDRKPDDDDAPAARSPDSPRPRHPTPPDPLLASPTYDSPSATPSTPSTSPEATPGEADQAPPADQAAEVAGDLLADTTPIPPAGSTGADAGLPDTPQEAADESELAISGAVVAAGLAAILLALGAGWEFERIHPRRWLRRPDLSRLRRLLPR